MKISQLLYCFVKRCRFEPSKIDALILLSFLFSFASISLSGQSISPFSINPFGNVATKSNTMLSWTVGEICGPYVCQPGLCLSEGFQQSTIQIIGIEVPENEKQSFVSAFPNPATDIINIQFRCARPEKAIIQIFDVTGKKWLETETMQGPGNSIYTFSVEGLPGQLLLLKITFPDKRISRSFRIIKL